jgi:hypothetical protein
VIKLCFRLSARTGRRDCRARVCRLLACTWFAAFIAGCADAPKPVHGTITLDGKPLDEAVVLFVPLEPQRRKTGGAIVAGRYQIVAEDGLLPGKYRVEVADNPPLDGPRGKPPSARRKLPPHYAHDSSLSLTVDNVEGSTEHEFNFALTSAPQP